MTHPLIGIIGLKRSGKTVAADILARDFGYTPVAFADPLRDLIASINPIVDTFSDLVPDVTPVTFNDATEALGYERAKDSFPEYRRLLQDTGTEGVRDILGGKYGVREMLNGLDIWEAIAERRIDKAIAYVDVDPFGSPWGGANETIVWAESLVYTDVRFPGEADLIRRKGGIILRIERPDLPPANDAHRSETLMAAYEPDYTALNSGTLDDLADWLHAIITGLDQPALRIAA